MAWVIDPAHTVIEFSAKHMMITTVRGRFTRFNGELTIDEEQLERSRVEGTVETASVDTGETNRDAHLRSADFFEPERYPLMTFRSTGITRSGKGRYQVTGEMTIKGATRPVTFEVTDEGHSKDPWGNMRWGLSADTVINRKDFGLTWNVALETGGFLVGDQIKVHADLQAIYKPVAELQPEPDKELAVA